MAVRNRKKEQLLVVDDNPDTLEVIIRNLKSFGYGVFSATCLDEALRLLNDTPIDLIITDYKMPSGNGLDLIRHVRENFKNTEIIMITGYASVEHAVEAIKTGAEEYLPKPFTDEELLNAVKLALDKLNIRRKIQKQFPVTPRAPYGIIGESPEMKEVMQNVARAASTHATVLITGESGTGKELVARAIHYSSQRASATFVPVNCGGIPETLLESELFGYIKGAFTGATESRAGFFQTADGGTIFLDEISETSLAMQVKLLRVLQEKEVYMVGATRPRKVDARVLASSNKDLLSMVQKGTFREDLYFRLNVLPIDIPPLRERSDDILELIQYFARNFAEEAGKPAPKFSENALSVLKNYHWPGNVRELENVINRLIVMTDGHLIEVPDLPQLMRFSALRGTGINRTIAEVEAEHIRNVCAKVGGNKTRAAEILGIDRKTLREKLKRYGLQE